MSGPACEMEMIRSESGYGSGRSTSASVYERVYHGVRTDAKSQRQDDRQGIAWLVNKAAQRVASAWSEAVDVHLRRTSPIRVSTRHSQ
jgi:hypothetical protein